MPQARQPVPLRPLRAGMSRPWALAHRGASASHPENTAPALAAAVRSGADGIEIDVQVSRDGVPVLYHDRTLRRIGGGRARVRDRVLSDLRRLDAGGWFHRDFAGERLLTLQEALARFGHRTRLLVEIKSREGDRTGARRTVLARAVVRALREARMLRRVLLLCFDPETLTAARSLAPGLRTVLNMKAPERMSPAMRRLVAPQFAVCLERRTVHSSFVKACHRIGKPVMVYTCNTAAATRRILAAGADGVLSDRPDWLRAFLRERKGP